MIDYSDFFAYLKTTELKEVAGEFAARTQDALAGLSHGDYERWASAIELMPEVLPSRIDFAADAVTAGDADDISPSRRESLKADLMELHPWRKGPFDLFGIRIDTEWRSDLKWARLSTGGSLLRSKGMEEGVESPTPLAGGQKGATLCGLPTGQKGATQIVDLKDKLVLDVGCGNGYYLYRMLGAGAKAAVGVDPFLLYVMQFQAINKYVREERAAVLPLGADDVPDECGCFDTVFSMGILYHRKHPKDHLKQLYGFVKPGGQVVLETIVLDEEGHAHLKPKGRYGKMRNVGAIPSVELLTAWLEKSGFENIQVLDVTKTTSAEQRKTEWMTFESLADFLDPGDESKTIEGYPAPVRAILVAQKC